MARSPNSHARDRATAPAAIAMEVTVNGEYLATYGFEYTV